MLVFAFDYISDLLLIITLEGLSRECLYYLPNAAHFEVLVLLTDIVLFTNRFICLRAALMKTFSA